MCSGGLCKASYATHLSPFPHFLPREPVVEVIETVKQGVLTVTLNCHSGEGGGGGIVTIPGENPCQEPGGAHGVPSTLQT